VRTLHRSSSHHEVRDVFARIKPMAKSREPTVYIGGVIRRLGDVRTQAIQRVFDFRAKRFHIAERQGRGQKRHDFPIFAPFVTMREMHRIRFAPSRHVAPGPHVVERLSQRIIVHPHHARNTRRRTYGQSARASFSGDHGPRIPYNALPLHPARQRRTRSAAKSVRLLRP